MRTLFIGGGRHLAWIDVDPRLHDVELPWVEAPALDEGPDASFRLDLYREQCIYRVDEHPCVPNAGIAQLYRVFVWSTGLSPDAPTVVAHVEREGGLPVEQRHVGVPRVPDAPLWWTYPVTGEVAPFVWRL